MDANSKTAKRIGDKTMERKIGETFEFEGKTLRVEENKCASCDGCFFERKCSKYQSKKAGECSEYDRSDNKNVIFIEVKDEQPKETKELKERKIGEVFEFEGKTLKAIESKHYTCYGCFFNGNCVPCKNIGYCRPEHRTDKKNIMFVEVEQPQKLNLCDILKNCPQGEMFWSPLFGDVKFHDINQKRNFINIVLDNGVTWNINADGTISFGTTTSPEIMLYPSREQRDWTNVKYDTNKEKFDPKTLKVFDRVIVRDYEGEWKINIFSHICNCAYPYKCIVDFYNRCIPYNDDTKHLVGTNNEAPEFYRYWED